MKKNKYRFKTLTQRDLNLVRQIHITLLAKPKERTLRPWPDPKLEQTLPAPVSPAAMKAKPSERTIMLFKSKKQFQEGKKFTTPTKPQHYVSTAALKAVASTRTVKLATPKRHFKVKKKTSKKALLKRKKKFKKFQKHRGEWLEKNAKPKKVIPPTPLQVYTFGAKHPPVSQMERLERIYTLSRPTRRGTKLLGPKKKLVRYKLREVPDRVRELALPKRIPSETVRNMKFRPGKIKRSALKAVASERTKVLAVARPRSKAVDNDVREDAFTIPPAALTYKASKRIIELARPKLRK